MQQLVSSSCNQWEHSSQQYVQPSTFHDITVSFHRKELCKLSQRSTFWLSPYSFLCVFFLSFCESWARRSRFCIYLLPQCLSLPSFLSLTTLPLSQPLPGKIFSLTRMVKPDIQRGAAAAAKSLSRVWPCATPWTAAHQAPPSMGFSRQEYWSGVPLPSPTKGREGV